jgi:hypothetical protein
MRQEEITLSPDPAQLARETAPSTVLATMNLVSGQDEELTTLDSLSFVFVRRFHTNVDLHQEVTPTKHTSYAPLRGYWSSRRPSQPDPCYFKPTYINTINTKEVRQPRQAWTEQRPHYLWCVYRQGHGLCRCPHTPPELHHAWRTQSGAKMMETTTQLNRSYLMV